MDTKIVIAIISAVVAVLGAILSFYSASRNFKLSRNNQTIEYLNGKVDKIEKAIEGLNNVDINKVDSKDFIKEGVKYLEKYFDNAVEIYEKYRSYLTNYDNGNKLEEKIEQTKMSLAQHRIETEIISVKNESQISILNGDEIMQNYMETPKEIKKIFNAELKITIRNLEKLIGYKV